MTPYSYVNGINLRSDTALAFRRHIRFRYANAYFSSLPGPRRRTGSNAQHSDHLRNSDRPTRLSDAPRHGMPLIVLRHTRSVQRQAVRIPIPRALALQKRHQNLQMEIKNQNGKLTSPSVTFLLHAWVRSRKLKIMFSRLFPPHFVTNHD